MKILTEICLVGGGLFLLSWVGLIALFTLAWLADKRELRLMHDASPAWADGEEWAAGRSSTDLRTIEAIAEGERDA